MGATSSRSPSDNLGIPGESGVGRRPYEIGRRAGSWPAVLLLIAVIATRTPALFRVGLWRDEAATYFYATAPTSGAFIDLIRQVEENPPGFFYLMYLWVHAFGGAPAVMKVPAFAFSLVEIWLTYELGRRLHSGRVGLCAAVLVAATPLSTFMSLEARAYTLAACLCTSIVLLYQQACSAPSLRSSAALALAVAAALYVHYTAIPFLVAIAIVTAMRPRLASATRLRVFIALAAGAIPFAAWVPSFISQAQAELTAQDPASAAQAARIFLQVTWLFPGSAAVKIGLIALLATIVILRARGGRPPAMPINPLAIGLLTIAFIGVLNWPLIWYLLPFSPLLMVCVTAYIAEASLGLLSWSRRFGPAAARWMLPVVTALIALVELPGNARLVQTPFSGVPALVAEAKKMVEPTLYVLAPDYIASTFVYYDRSLGSRPLRFDAFARQDRPELFRYVDGYANLWNSTDLVGRSTERYLREANGAHFLALVDERTSPPLMRTKTDGLLDELRRHLQQVDRRDYDGTIEPLVVYRFRIPTQLRIPAEPMVRPNAPRARNHAPLRIEQPAAGARR